MAIPIYIPSNKIVHQVKVDFVQRNIPSVVHIVQGDNTLPVVKVKCTINNMITDIVEYLSPTEINIRCLNGGFSEVYSPILGIDEDGASVYFEVSPEMTESYGTALLVLEVKKDGLITNSSPFHLEIDKNPVWDKTHPSRSGGVKFQAIDVDIQLVNYRVVSE